MNDSTAYRIYIHTRGPCSGGDSGVFMRVAQSYCASGRVMVAKGMEIGLGRCDVGPERILR